MVLPDSKNDLGGGPMYGPQQPLMTPDERAAIIEELAEAMFLQDYPGLWWKQQIDVKQAEYRRRATACLPIIDRLLAAHDLDGVLGDCEGLQDFSMTTGPKPKYIASLRIRRDGEYTRVLGESDIGYMDAIRAAVAKAHGSTGEGGEG